jgi:hypothetical protein
LSDDKTESTSGESEGGGDEGERKSQVTAVTTRKPSSPKLGKVIPLPTKREVDALHMSQLTASGLTAETIELAKLYSEYHHQRIAELLQRRVWPRAAGGALVLPFYLPGESEPYAYRIRPDSPRVERKKNGKERAVKYDQASDAGLLVYFTPRASAGGWYRDETLPLHWTEGEKKALALDQLGLPCVGLTGIWNWLDADHREATNEKRLHPLISKHVHVAGRRHVIVYDYDVAQDEKKTRAARELAGLLRAGGAAEVRFVHPPDAGEKGIDDYLAKYGEAATRTLLSTASEIEAIAPDAPLPRLRSLKPLRDAPLDESLRMPEGYELRRDGSLWAEAASARGSDTLVSRLPLYLTRWLVDHYSGELRAEFTYARSDDQWVTMAASARALRDLRTMVAELAPYGVPVTSMSAGRVIEWLDAFDHANPQLPRIACVPSGGWHRVDGVPVFASHTIIAPAEARVEVVVDSRGDRRRIFEALAPRGSLAEHVCALSKAWAADSTCAIAICAAFAATLLEPLRAPNFAVHFGGESSRGKTSMLKIAASAFGDPHNPHWVPSWNTTAAGAEARASILCDLPQCYDEVGGNDVEETERLLYALINGRGRTRAARDMSTRESTTWRTVLLSTGERELAGDDTATGAKVRVIQLNVFRFGELGASDIDALVNDCAANSGSAGARWLKQLVEYDEWPRARAALAELTKRLRSKGLGDPLQGRVAAYYALLALTERFLAEWIGLGDRKGETMQEVFSNIGVSAPNERADAVQAVGARARELLEDWIQSDPDGFPELEERGTVGEFDAKSRGKVRHGFRRDGLIYLIPSEFRAWCLRNRLWALEVVRQWSRLGWTLHDTGRLDKQVRIGGRLSRFYVLYPHAESTFPEGST